MQIMQIFHTIGVDSHDLRIVFVYHETQLNFAVESVVLLNLGFSLITVSFKSVISSLFRPWPLSLVDIIEEQNNSSFRAGAKRRGKVPIQSGNINTPGNANSKFEVVRHYVMDVGIFYFGSS